MTLRFAAVVFSALAVLAGHVVQGPGASAGGDAGRQADSAAIEKFHQQDIAGYVVARSCCADGSVDR